MKNFAKILVLFAVVALIGCSGDKAAEANKNLKPVDPNAPKPQGASAAGGGSAGASVAK